MSCRHFFPWQLRQEWKFPAPPHSSPQLSETAVREMKERRSLSALMTEAADYWHRTLSADIRERILRSHYGFTDDTIDALKLGWCCFAWRMTEQELRGCLPIIFRCSAFPPSHPPAPAASRGNGGADYFLPPHHTLPQILLGYFKNNSKMAVPTEISSPASRPSHPLSRFYRPASQRIE